MDKIVFIVNPISGGRKKQKAIDLIHKLVDKSKFEYEIAYTQYAGHAVVLTQSYIQKGFKYIVAVGGDGTVNEIGKTLANTDSVLGIIPFGSGNGLARHLGIPMQTDLAILKINAQKHSKIDVCQLNDYTFLGTAGAGFDAHIGHVFANLKGRGFFNYIKAVIKEFNAYQPEVYTIEFENKSFDVKALMITAANSSQYGNNAYVAPHADIQDGILDLIVIKPFGWLQAPSMGYRLFNKLFHKSKYVDVYTGKQFTITRRNSVQIHIDGEPAESGMKLNLSINKQVLNVLV